MVGRRKVIGGLVAGILAIVVAIPTGIWISQQYGYNTLAAVSTVFAAETVLIGIVGLIVSHGSSGNDRSNNHSEPSRPSDSKDTPSDDADGFTPKVSDEEIRVVLRGTDEGDPLTTEEIADKIGCRAKDAYEKLDLLRGYGIAKRRRVDEDTVEWWGGTAVRDLSDDAGSSRELEEEADHLRKERLDSILSGGGPRGFDMQSNLVLHIIPKLTLDDGDVNIDSIPDFPKNVIIGRTTYTQREYNTDGRVFSWEPKGESITYVQFFRNGLIESVDSFMLEANEGKSEDVIPSEKFEQQLMLILERYLDILEQDLDVSPPIFVALSFTGVKGYSMALSSPKNATYTGRNEFEQNQIESPVVRVDDFDQSTVDILREPLRYVWNAAGFKDSVYFDEDGEWTLG